MPYSCIFGCKNPGHLHVFPNPAKDPERYKTWVSIIDAKLKTPSANIVYKKKRICDIHFLNEHKNRNNRLSSIAMPLLHLPEESQRIADTVSPAINSKKGLLEAIIEQCEISDSQQSSQAIGDALNVADTLITATCNFPAASGASDSNHSPSTFIEHPDSVISREELEHQVEDMESEEDEQWVSQADVCRCCLAASGTLDARATVVTDSGTEQVLSEMLQECFGITLRLWGAGGGAGAVCAACAGQLRAAARFKRQVLRCDARFTRYWALEEMEFLAENESIGTTGLADVECPNKKWKSLKTKTHESLEQSTQAPRTNFTEAAGPTSAGNIDISTFDALKRPATVLTYRPPLTKRQKKETVRELKPDHMKTNDLTITISRADDEPLDEDAADVIENRLIDLRERAVIARVDAASISLATSGLSDGRYLVTATNENAKNWLLNRDFGTYNGVDLVTRPIGRTKVSIYLPHSNGEYVENSKENRKLSVDPLKLIEPQNKRQSEIWTIVNI